MSTLPFFILMEKINITFFGNVILFGLNVNFVEHYKFSSVVYLILVNLLVIYVLYHTQLKVSFYLSSSGCGKEESVNHLDMFVSYGFF